MTRALMWLAAASCGAIYLSAYWSEAAYYAGSMGFAETISWSRLAEALPAVSWADIRQAETLYFDYLVLSGVILVAVVAGGMHRAAWRAAGRWILTVYTVLLILGGGWLGLLALLYSVTLFCCTIDGEFLDDNLARVCATGIWTLVTIVLSFSAWLREEENHPTNS